MDEQTTTLNFKGGIPESHKWQHKNAIKSFKDLKPNGRYRQIIRTLRESSIPLTDREIMRELGFIDPNEVRPRISELIDFEVLQECGKTIDSNTRRTVRIVKINSEFQLELF